MPLNREANPGPDASTAAVLMPVQHWRAQDDLLSLGMRADQLRRSLHPDGVVTYTNSAHIFMAGGAESSAVPGRVEQALELGARGVTLAPPAGGRLSFAAWTHLLQSLHTCFPSLWIEGPAPHTVLTLAADEGLPVEELLLRLRRSGLNGLAADEDAQPGFEALGIHRAAHAAGIHTTAVLPVSLAETTDQRLLRLEAIYRLQDETAGFRALSVTAPAPRGTYLSDELTAVEFLTALATARLALPNVPNIESSWAAQGLKLLQMTLRFGANDAGSTLVHRTLAHPGPDTPTEEDLRRVIRDAGLRPVERSADYTICYLA